SSSALARAVRRDLEIERDVPVGIAEAQERFAQRGEDGAGIASQLRAEMLRSVEHAGALEEIDAAIDLPHMLPLAERVQRELRGDGLAEDARGGHGRERRLDPGRQRLARPYPARGRADGIVGLAGTAARYRRHEHAMRAASSPSSKEIPHGREEPLRRSD